MAWEFTAVGTAATAGSGTTLTPAAPSGAYGVGDDLIAICASRTNSDTWSTSSPGWGAFTGAAFNGIAVFRKTATSTSEASPTFTRTQSTGSMICIIIVTRGGLSNNATIVDTSATSGDAVASTTIATAGIAAPSEANCAVVAIGKWHDNTSGNTFARPAWSTNKLFEPFISTGGGLTLVGAYVIQTAAASIASGSFGTASVSALDYSIVLALKSAPDLNAGSPQITDTTSIQVGETFTVTGTGFSATGNTVTIGGAAQSISTQSTTSIACNAVSLGALMYGRQQLVVTTSTGLTDTVEIDLQPETTARYVNIDALYPAENGIQNDYGLSTGIQYRWTSPTNATLANTAINTRGDVAVLPTVPSTAVTIQVQDNVGSGWSTATTITVQQAAAAPVFAGPINNTTVTLGAASTAIVASSFFTSAASYALSGALPTGGTFDTASGHLTLPAQVAGSWSFTITATNGSGSTNSNSFTYTVNAVTFNRPWTLFGRRGRTRR